MRKKCYLVVLALVLVLTGCTQSATTVSSEPSIEVSPFPTSTAVITPLPTSTSTPDPTGVDLDPRGERMPVTVTVQAPTPGPPQVIGTPFPSPDGEWIATVEEGFFQDHQESAVLRIVSTNGITEWIADTITEKTIFGGFERAIPLRWSEDGQHLYFTHARAADGCISNFWGSDLHRIDLLVGKVTEIVPEVGYWLVISPDERTLAYLSFGRGVVLHDLVAGTEQEIDLDIEREHAGKVIHKSDLFWSPDGRSLVLIVAIDVCGPEWANAVVRVDIDTRSQAILIHESDRLFSVLEWSDARRILLRDMDGDLWWMNAVTGEVTRVE